VVPGVFVVVVVVVVAVLVVVIVVAVVVVVVVVAVELPEADVGPLAQDVYHEDLPPVRRSHFRQRTQVFKRVVCEKATQSLLASQTGSQSFGCAML